MGGHPTPRVPPRLHRTRLDVLLAEFVRTEMTVERLEQEVEALLRLGIDGDQWFPFASGRRQLPDGSIAVLGGQGCIVAIVPKKSLLGLSDTSSPCP